MTKTYITDAYVDAKHSTQHSKNDIPESGPIKIDLVWTNVHMCWPCSVCGGSTDKDSVLAEGPDGLRVCHDCMKDGDFDARLEAHIARKEEHAQFLRTLIGRLQVPTYQEWRDECDRHEAYSCECAVEDLPALRERRLEQWKADKASL